MLAKFHNIHCTCIRTYNECTSCLLCEKTKKSKCKLQEKKKKKKNKLFNHKQTIKTKVKLLRNIFCIKLNRELIENYPKIC